ncbi:unnamed protein product [Polarella glacialis]|uniref:Uncharacterized protein n=1 Tax=Polarella glacialis TaxID=89957 RepID=A0A813DLK4_POLGL|nr:unnamed protein product [Polarella glacialis]
MEEQQDIWWQLDRLETSLYKFGNLTDNLINTKEDYNASLHAAVGSCTDSNPLAKKLVTSLAGALDSSLEEVHIVLHVIKDCLTTTIELLDLFQTTRVTPFFRMVLWIPTIPAFLVVLQSMFILVTWKIGKIPLGLEKRGVIIVSGLVMIFSAVLASLSLYSSILMTGYCINVDANLIDTARRTNFSSMVEEKYDLDAVIQHTARYYLAGTSVNPLATSLQNLQAALRTISIFYDKFQWVIDLVFASCSGYKAMDPSKVVKALLETTEGAWDFINADNIWPYYDRTVHGIFCRHLPRLLHSRDAEVDFPANGPRRPGGGDEFVNDSPKMFCMRFNCVSIVL